MHDRTNSSTGRACLLSLIALLCAGSASSYEIRLVSSSPNTVGVGDLVQFDAYLDTQGESDILGIQVGLGFDNSIFMYRPDLSGSEDFVLYSPSTGLGDPPRWLEPPPNGCCDPPAIWPGPGPLHIDFLFVSETILNLDPSKTGTLATATNAYLGTVVFEAISTGTTSFDWGFEHDLGGNAFLLSDAVDIQAQVDTPGGGAWSVVPEPGTAALLGLGLALASFTRTRRHA